MIPARVKFRHLQCLLQTARLGGVAKAAKSLGVSQPAVSKALAELEEILGVQLMERGRGGVVLTPVGEMFVRYAGASVAALRQGLDGVARSRMEEEIVLTVGVLPSVAGRVVPAAVDRFRRAQPGVTLKVVSGPNLHLLDQLRLGALDLVLGRLGAPDTMMGLSFTHLYSETVSFVVRPGHPLASAPDLSGITAYPVLVPDQEAAIRGIVERYLLASGIGHIPDRIETVSNDFGRAYTRRSDAVWIISSGVVALDVQEGALVELPFEVSDTSGPVGVTTRADAEVSPAARSFIDAMEHASAAAMPSLKT
ncbi:pca operon transcription factor PcaQ [Amorphus orientalis]|nr:pca operon transcription factor PcaQ [Amorphus orientalis]